MHISIGRWKSVTVTAIALAILVTAGCGGSGNGDKANPNIIGTWLLRNITTPVVNGSGGGVITCPGAGGGLGCTIDQEAVFANNGTYQATTNDTVIATGVYNINGNVLSVQYSYTGAPGTTYTDTYVTTILLPTPGTVRTLYATLSTTNSPTNHAYIGAQFGYGLL